MKLSPMMEQYISIKKNYEDCILFFRLGDFYEMFNEDAKLVSKELELTLTSRDRGKPEAQRTPMCGVPYHSCEAYIAPMASWRHRSSSSADFGLRHISWKERRSLRTVVQSRLPFL